MILNKTVVVNLNPANISHYEDKKYSIPKVYNTKKNKYIVPKGSTILVDIDDLTKTSNVLIDVVCDYCGEVKLKSYKEYMRSINGNEFVRKYCCENCDHHKKQEIYEYKQSHNMLKRGEKGYWNFKENRLKELDNYIKKHGTITRMRDDKEGCLIATTISHYGDDIKECCIELGYDLDSVIDKYRPEHFYNNFENLKADIINLIGVLNRFPKQKEVLQNLRISNNILLQYGGINEIKNKLGYCDESDLIDDRGYKNLSAYEYMTAQYLIGNNIFYKREVHPFKNKYKNLRSDFTFYLDNDQEIHLEIWGYSRNDLSSNRSVAYNKKRLIKENLYKEYGHILIGIDYELFQGKYSEVQKKLFDVFKPYLNLVHKEINIELFLPANKMSNEELLNEIMKYSDNQDILPKQVKLKANNASGLYIEAVKRYGSYHNFAKAFNKYSIGKYNTWNKVTIFNAFDHMSEFYNGTLNSSEIKIIKDNKIKGIEEGCKQVFGTYFNARIEYFDYIVTNNKILAIKDVEYLNNALQMKRGFNRSYLTEEKLNRIKSILFYCSKHN